MSDHLPDGPTPSAKEEGWNPSGEMFYSRDEWVRTEREKLHADKLQTARLKVCEAAIREVCPSECREFGFVLFFKSAKDRSAFVSALYEYRRIVKGEEAEADEADKS